jgi:hypothetical protein
MARRYVQQSPHLKKLPAFTKERLVKGIARLLNITKSASYKIGFADGFKKRDDAS